MKYVFKTDRMKRYEFPTHINDLVMDRSEAAASEVFVVIVEPGKGAPLHKHDDTEQIFHILEGKGTLVIGKEEIAHTVVPGDVVRVPMSTWHSIRAEDGRMLKYLAIDCFGGKRNADEPTWEDHVRVVCRERNWPFDQVCKGYVK